MYIASPIGQFLGSLEKQGIKFWIEGERLRYGAPKDVVTPALRLQMTERKDEISAFLRTTQQRSHHINIPRAIRPERLPLSFSQQRLWFLDQLDSGNAYNMHAALKLSGSLNVGALQQALQEIVQRHESLHTTFAVDEDQPYQVINEQMVIELSVVDLSTYSSERQTIEVKRLTSAEANHPFDLSRDPMLRATLLKLDVVPASNHILLLTMHHIASDGWSMGVLVQEINTLYAAFCQGRHSPLPDLTIQYADFAVWQRDYLSGEKLEQQLNYWNEQLANAPELLQLPTDRPRPAQQSFRGAAMSVEIDKTLTQQLRQLSQQQGCTLYMLSLIHI